MPSVIKTKINTEVLPFNRQIRYCHGKGDLTFLREFVKHCHNNPSITEEGDHSLRVQTARNSYVYICYPEYIKKINLTNDERTFYKIT